MSIRAGFSLLEATLGLAIVGTIAIAGLALVAADARSTAKALEYLNAAALAQHRLAEVHLLTARELAELQEGASGRFPKPFEDYQWTIAATPSARDSTVHLVVQVAAELAHVQLVGVARRQAR